MNLLHVSNEFLREMLSNGMWNIFEAHLGLGVVFGCLMQRSWSANLSSSPDKNPYHWIAIKIGQFGLYMQIMMGVYSLLDAYYCEQLNISHPFMSLWCLNLVLTKFSVYLNLFKKKSVESA